MGWGECHVSHTVSVGVGMLGESWVGLVDGKEWVLMIFLFEARGWCNMEGDGGLGKRG